MQSLCKLNSNAKGRPLKVMVLGLSGVGKTALIVRFVTKRFIGDYDPNLERVYHHQSTVGKDKVAFEILDSAGGHCQETERVQLESNIRWAEAFVLMYSVTDKCSFDECNRLRFLISYNKRRRRGGSNDVAVVLVGNKVDQLGERMVTKADGERRAHDIGCDAFHEVSVRENVDDAFGIFADVHRTWTASSRAPRLKRSTSDLHHGGPINLDLINALCRNRNKVPTLPTWPERSASADWTGAGVFRERASTDGQLQANKKVSYKTVKSSLYGSPLFSRRMSISMRGNNN